MSQIINILPALGLRGLKAAALTGYADLRISDLFKNMDSFPGLKPTPMDVNDVNEQYKAALSAPRSKSNTIYRKKVRRALEIILIRCALSCAIIAEGKLEIYLLSGFDYKRKRGADQSLFALQNLSLELGKEEGTLKVRFKTVKNASLYQIWYGLHDAPYDSWESFVVSTSGNVLLEDLESGIHYKVRVRGFFGKKGYSPWSNTIFKKTY